MMTKIITMKHANLLRLKELLLSSANIINLIFILLF